MDHGIRLVVCAGAVEVALPPGVMALLADNYLCHREL